MINEQCTDNGKGDAFVMNTEDTVAFVKGKGWLWDATETNT